MSAEPSAEQARVLAKGPFPDYPFTPKAFIYPDGLAQSYLDEGPREGEVVVMLHGNPSWSFYWRKLVLGLRDPASSKGYRCIVPDHIGMGLSDKPGDSHYTYTLQSRIDDLDRLLDSLNLGDKLTLAMHDWGGMIGFGWALKHAARIKRLVILNTAAFPLPAAKALPWQLKLGRDSKFGAGLIRGFNAFSGSAASFGVEAKMPAAVRRAYVAPYDSWANRISTLRFVQDIPLKTSDSGYDLVGRVEENLGQFRKIPTVICWGDQDFVFDRHFLRRWTECLPEAAVHRFPEAGHFVLEDAGEEIIPIIDQFLQQHPIHE